MKLIFDTSKITNVSYLGRILMHFLEVSDVNLSSNDPTSMGDWDQVTDTPRPLLVAIMGDGIYDDSPRWKHLRHKETGLNVIGYDNGMSTNVLFHKDGENGFTILSWGGNLMRWKHESLEDPRNDPDYGPFK